MSDRRTPPKSSTTTKLIQARSDSDIPQAMSSSPFGNVNTTSRSKRPCPEPSPSPKNKEPASSPRNSDLQDFKQEIRQMLTTWKKEQQDYLTKIINEQSTQLKRLVSDIAELKIQNNSMQKSFSEMESTVTFISKQYDDMSKQLESLQKEKRACRDSMQQQDAKLQDLQQLSRSSIIEIRNVPNKEKETATDLTSVVSRIGATINTPVDRTQVRDIYRLPGKPGTVRPIVVEFTNVETKNQMITSIRNFNKGNPIEGRLNTLSIGLGGDRRPIYVAEYLPASSRKLFYITREFAKRMEYKYCWTSNGNIFLRKEEGARQLLIKSEQSLADLQVQMTK
ncbi:unnamed protein product [Spodoptera littoralis]|uniref:FP protein C-terminal domain-containing protein n=1 Tax=Spodoptera littoralis TaxID=7109 RepID=A0A9P0N636_SPOLI|nr:unnamed protein product [Spodoptera littoralis]CAH1646373.1 unnamed protein product [Spodoptera littoralis]